MASRSWNKVELIGNLTRDPELRYTPSGAAVVSFTIATNRTYVSEGERKEEADFHRVIAWNKLAELCSQLLKKGNRVFVSGRLQNRSWEGQDGQPRNITEIVIEDMILLTSKNGSMESDYTQSRSAAKAQPAENAIGVKQEESKTEPAEKVPDVPAAEEAIPAEDTQTPKKEDPGDLDDLPF